MSASFAAGLLALLVIAILTRFLRAALYDLIEQIGRDTLRSFFAWLTARKNERRFSNGRARQWRIPSLSQGLVGLAERRLPSQMTSAERERWGREMRADVASLPRRRRLRAAFNIWRKGAPGMPVAADGAPRSARD